MKRIISIILITSFAFTMSFCMADFAYASSKGIHFEKSPIYVTIGGGITQHLLTKTGKIINANKVSWVSSNKKVATVSKKGKVSGIKKGTVTLKAVYKGKTYKCKAYVGYAKKSFSEANLVVGESIKQIIYAASGNKASIDKIEFTSANDKVAIVDDTGLITAVSNGTVKIYAKYFGKKYITVVNVLEKETLETKENNQKDSFISGGQSISQKEETKEERTHKDISDEEESKENEPSDVMKNTSYKEYESMSGSTQISFMNDFIKKYGDDEFNAWYTKMLAEKEKAQKEKEASGNISVR